MNLLMHLTAHIIPDLFNPEIWFGWRNERTIEQMTESKMNVPMQIGDRFCPATNHSFNSWDRSMNVAIVTQAINDVLLPAFGAERTLSWQMMANNYNSNSFLYYRWYNVGIILMQLTKLNAQHTKCWILHFWIANFASKGRTLLHNELFFSSGTKHDATE